MWTTASEYLIVKDGRLNFCPFSKGTVREQGTVLCSLSTDVVFRKGENIDMTKLDDFIEEQLQDPVFKEKYDALEPEFVVMQAMIDARKEKAGNRGQFSVPKSED